MALKNQVRIGNIDLRMIKPILEQMHQTPDAPIDADPRVVQICKQMHEMSKKIQSHDDVKRKAANILEECGFGRFLKE